MNKRMQGLLSILAALFVLFSAMINPRFSMEIAVAIIFGFGVWQLGAWITGLKHTSELAKRQAEQKEANINKILEMLSAKDRITNQEVESELNVSDATATRYLDELEKEGKITQEGTDGRYVYYKKI
jgi:predicted transcriptional regulator